MGECLNLRAEIARKKLSLRQLASCLGISERALRNKINGLSDFTLKEANIIYYAFFIGTDKHELFARQDKAS